MSAALVPFTFRGDALEVARLPDGDVGLSLRRLCEVLGLDPDSQFNRLARAAKAGCRWATASIMEAVGADGRSREMTFLPRRSVPLWAATVDASRVAPEVREKLCAYQDECAEVLADAFLGGQLAPPHRRALTPEARARVAQIGQMIADAGREGDAHAVRALSDTLTKLLPQAPGRPRVSRTELKAEILAYVRKNEPTSLRGIAAKLHRGVPLVDEAVRELREAGTLTKRLGAWIVTKPASEALQ